MEQTINNERTSTMKQEILDITNLNQRGDLQMANLFSKKTTGWSEDGSEKNLTVLNTYDDEISEDNSVNVRTSVYGAIRLNTTQAINFNEEVVVSKQEITVSVEDAKRLIEELQRAVDNPHNA